MAYSYSVMVIDYVVRMATCIIHRDDYTYRVVYLATHAVVLWRSYVVLKTRCNHGYRVLSRRRPCIGFMHK